MLTADQLNSGTHLMAVTEDLQVIWFDVEDHLKQVVSDGLVVQMNIDSAGQSKPRHHHQPRVGPGHPSSPLPIYFILPFLLFPFFHWLYLFSTFVHPFPFYQNSPTPFPGRRP